MKVIIDSKCMNFRTVWLENSTVKMIDQTKLPFEFEIHSSSDYQQTAQAIKNMILRGAPAIGVTAGFGLAQASLEASENDFLNYVEKARETLRNTRPTAYNLFWALDRVFSALERGKTVEEKRKFAVEEAKKIAEEDIESCKKIGEYGNSLIKDCDKILTHCNAGALAVVDIGTALAPIRFAHYSGKRIFVYVDETAPRRQGAKLTAWELLQEDIPHAVIPDNAAGYFMQKNEVDLAIVGADRVAVNGDTANKIGTYEKAVLAKENSIPFYVALPTSTIDFEIGSGREIPIEERNEEEVAYVHGYADGFEKVRVVPEGSKIRNPAFDVTPARYITAFITEKGIIKPSKIRNLGNKMQN